MKTDRRRRLIMRPRRLFVKVHRWTSLVLLAWLVVIGVTGAWLAVNDGVESQFDRSLYRATDGDVGFDAAVDAAMASAPEGSVVSLVNAPSDGRGVYQVHIDEPAGGDAIVSRRHLVDPGTGNVNGTAVDDQGATWWLYRGHMYLWQDQGVFGVFNPDNGWCRRNETGHEPGGVRGVVCDVIPEGDDMVAWFTIGWMIVLATGFYLWYWPGVRRWATAFVVKRSRGRFAFQMSLHKVIGLVVWVPLMIVAFTGAAFAFPNLGRWYDNLTPAQRDVSLWTPPDDLVSSEADGRTSLGLDEIAAVVADRYPQRQLESLTPPADETGTYSAWVTRGFSPWTREGSGGNTFMSFDQYTGEVLYDGTPEEGNVFDQAWDDYNFPLHTGDFAGPAGRWLWSLLALSPIALGATGLIMNRVRAGKRRARTVDAG
jgi:uncharacterized iron-regulated membrane protein